MPLFLLHTFGIYLCMAQSVIPCSPYTTWEGPRVAVSSVNVLLVGLSSSLDKNTIETARTAMMVAFNKVYHDFGISMERIEIVKQGSYPQKQQFLRSKLGSFSRRYVSLSPNFEIRATKGCFGDYMNTIQRAKMQRRWEDVMCKILQQSKEFSNKLESCLVLRNRMDDLRPMQA
jgi:hypothetical protein